MKMIIGLFAISVVLAVNGTPAFAFYLTDADYAYMHSEQHVPRDSPNLRNLSPKEQWMLHALIRDAIGATDAAHRNQLIADALKEISEHQHWEEMNPGKLWDSPRR